jgi:hypothetical protein
MTRETMIHLTDALVEAAITPHDAQQAMLQAFQALAGGHAALQERMRT